MRKVQCSNEMYVIRYFFNKDISTLLDIKKFGKSNLVFRLRYRELHYRATGLRVIQKQNLNEFN